MRIANKLARVVTYSFVLSCSRGVYCIFSNFSPPKSFYNDPPILPKVKLGPTLTFYHQSPRPHPILGFFYFTGNKKTFKTRQSSF